MYPEQFFGQDGRTVSTESYRGKGFRATEIRLTIRPESLRPPGSKGAHPARATSPGARLNEGRQGAGVAGTGHFRGSGGDGPRLSFPAAAAGDCRGRRCASDSAAGRRASRVGGGVHSLGGAEPPLRATP